SRRVAGSVNHAKPSDLVALPKEPFHPKRRTRHEPISYLDGNRTRQHGGSSFHGGRIGFMAGERHLELLSDRLCLYPVIGMVMGQLHHMQSPASKLAENSSPSPPRSGVDQNVLDQINVDEMRGKPAQLPNAWGQFFHFQTSLPPRRPPAFPILLRG